MELDQIIQADGYRAALWVSSDGQHEVVLTSRCQEGLDDAALLAAARKEAARSGTDLANGDLVIGEWVD